MFREKGLRTNTKMLWVWPTVAALGCATTQPAAEQTSDAWITSKVKSKLAADPEVNPFEIDVDTDDGIVRLSGLVDEESDRQEAEEIARNTEGVVDVINQLEMGEQSAAGRASDAAISSNVKLKLTSDPEVNAFNIDVDTTQGIVTLSGLVKSEREKEEAEALARNTGGVKEVRNRIEVVPEIE